MVIRLLLTFNLSSVSPLSASSFSLSHLFSVCRSVSGTLHYTFSSSFGDCSLPQSHLYCLSSCLSAPRHHLIAFLYELFHDACISRSFSVVVVVVVFFSFLQSSDLHCCPFPHCSAAILKRERENDSALKTKWLLGFS